ncbi:MAG: hypothetical protein A3A04_02470 [Candidatus Harrisonbacteria bacterium RIFCSPLOWO2_01_FULL_40_28]|uniref:Elongation factor P n=2 Tax=Candidatus Harrisoniibacteriota TaxID=1817905 RepID=A0A1G1ZW75_9BACT|nr:MAG: hypothetical protein A3A04_02470 [Candidatus Harrisonbacteria bacterium RIFCSPLOWO2_01_FULL_40_28]OGY68729.1 MAG: hypothetical protein A2586_00915 [Candidatus Harrisonbacteria bacterium RIFOXYD1_FULL_40_9]
MLTYNDLKVGTVFILENDPYQVIEFSFLRMQQRKPVAQVKMKNLINGKIITRNFHQNETFEEAEIIKEPLKYLYNHRGECFFSNPKDPKERFSLQSEQLGTSIEFIKQNSEVVALKFNEKIISIQVPVKVELEVKETPPGERGNTAQGGVKTALLETGAKVQVPLFINSGDIIRVNTELGAYVERVTKAQN